MRNLITCLVVCVSSSATFADTWTVDDDGKADFDNIQAAVDAASDGDEIIVMPGTYTGIGGEVVNMLGKAVWLHSSGGQEVTIIDGQGARRGILCSSDETNKTIIEGFTITNGYTDYYGGGMYNSGSGSLGSCNPTLTDCTFTGNTASDGGGIYNNGGSNPTLTNCSFTSNMADKGGGMYNSGGSKPTLENCAFTGNSADYGSGMYTTSSSPMLENCTFENNTADYYSSGMHNDYNSSPTVINCTFTGNSGRGMYNSTNSNPTVTNCTFTGNSTRGMHNYESGPTLTDCTFENNTGGGIYNEWNNKYNNVTVLINCTFTGNTALYGGGMYNVWSNSTLTNCTFTGNTASDGGGIYSSYGSTTLTDTTVCDNQVGQIYGEWNDYGGNTVANVCSLKGTCCTNDICLDSEEEVDCIHFGGEWLGAGTACEDNPCPTSCPGDINGDGQVNVNDLVILIAYWGVCP
jgi:parallel beta-helix repeat protein/predicted outer membrane repeat protein